MGSPMAVPARDLQQGAASLQDRDNLYRRVIAEADAVAYQRDVKTRKYIFIGDGIERLTGHPAEGFTLTAFMDLLQETVMRGPCAGLSPSEAVRMVHSGDLDVWHADLRILTREGQERWLADTSILLRDDSGEAIGSLGILQDITDRKRAEEALARLAVTDELTGLHNRRHLMERLRQEFIRSKRYWSPLCLLMLDLDHFKAINDAHGHMAGDEVLITVARLIRESTRATDIAGRYGGEEFCIALVETEMDGALVTAERIRAAVAQAKFHSDKGSAFCATVSVGISQLHTGAQDISELLSEADAALYEAKSAGRNRIACAAKR